MYLKNPSIIVEVLSKSTATYDEGEKKIFYFSIPSLKDYITIQTENPVVSVHSREKNGKWTTVVSLGLKSEIYLPNFDVSIEMKNIYRGVKGLKEPK